MKSRIFTVLVLAATACNRPQKSCTFDNNGRHFCIEWRGYTSEELSSMICMGGKIEDGRECSRKGATGYCVVKDEKKHENRDFSYEKTDGATCSSPNVWVPLR